MLTAKVGQISDWIEVLFYRSSALFIRVHTLFYLSNHFQLLFDQQSFCALIILIYRPDHKNAMCSSGNPFTLSTSSNKLFIGYLQYLSNQINVACIMYLPKKCSYALTRFIISRWSALWKKNQYMHNYIWS